MLPHEWLINSTLLFKKNMKNISEKRTNTRSRSLEVLSSHHFLVRVMTRTTMISSRGLNGGWLPRGFYWTSLEFPAVATFISINWKPLKPAPLPTITVLSYVFQVCQNWCANHPQQKKRWFPASTFSSWVLWKMWSCNFRETDKESPWNQHIIWAVIKTLVTFHYTVWDNLESL